MKLENVLVILIFLSHKRCQSKRNNACSTFQGYGNIDNSPDCYYNPDVDIKHTVQIINKYVENTEVHTKTTSDGYIVTAYRMPRENPRGVAVLFHPFTGDSTVWVATGNTTLAFLLWYSGYDVWLPNNRGTFESPGHVNLSSTDYKYSDFSFHEIALIDHKMWIEFISAKTKRNDLVYVGHSMSCTTGLIYSSMLPEEAKKYIKVFILMASPYTFRYIDSFKLRLTSQFQDVLKVPIEAIQLGGIYRSPVLPLVHSLLLQYPINKLIWTIGMFYVGWTPNEIDPGTFATLAVRMPRGIPIKIIYHYGQHARSNRFQMFDYGPTKNRQLYGQKIPPLYPIKNISVPIYLVYSDADTMTSERDALILFDDLPEKAKIYGKLQIHGFNHLDYHVGKRRVKDIFYPVLQFINKIFT